MGYSHTFNFKTEITKFDDLILQRIRTVLNEYGNIVQEEYDIRNLPIITEELIMFNGIGEDNGYETFYLTNATVDRNSCKTARRSYDLPVCEILLLLKYHYKDNFRLESDGFWVSKEDFENKILDENWDEALDNVKRKFGYNFSFEENISESNGYKYYKFIIQ